MEKFKKLFKRIVVDTAGYGLIILGLLFGWLPGPGGIPLIFAGLGLLSIYNPWAKKLLRVAKDRGNDALYVLFPRNFLVEIIHDVVVVILICISAWILIYHRTYINIGIAIALIAIAIVDFSVNRERFKKRTKR
jgi:hypothetical protein